MARHTLCGRDGETFACPVCEVLEDQQERAWAKDQCGAVSLPPMLLVCDRESGHEGNHRGYVSQHDDVLFWSARPHDIHCAVCDMAEFAGITYAAAHLLEKN